VYNISVVNVDIIINLGSELSPEERQAVLLALLTQQRHNSISKPNIENATLIDLRGGFILGSNRCNKCDGYLGNL